jgi:putative folate metabolism gamma-glutamate ligase
MKITAYKTRKVHVGDDLYEILDQALPQLVEKSVVVISAKIVALCEGNVVKYDDQIDKETLIKQAADQYITDTTYYKQTMLTIKNHVIVPYAGVDESNGNGYLIKWPKDIMQSTAMIWKYLRKKYGVKDSGVILSDSYFVPLRRGAVGVGLGWCGFQPIQNYIGNPDVFGKKLHYTTSSHIDGLAAAAEVLMGEGDEQTPIAVIENIPFVTFQNREPTKEEIAEMKPTEKDYFSPVLSAAPWQKGGGKN